jgi:hypothetical protein
MAHLRVRFIRGAEVDDREQLQELGVFCVEL